MNDDLALTIEREERQGGIVVLELAGELVITNRETLRQQGESEIAGGARGLVIAVGRLSHVDTSGLATLVHLATRCAESGGRLAVAGLPDDFGEIRQHLYLDEAVRFADSVEDAVAAVSR